MAIVVSDTSPICYLLLIGQIDLLPFLYERVMIPQEVYVELAVMGSPEIVQQWIANPPSWVDIRNVDVQQASRMSAESNLDGLDPGERAAILLAEQLDISLVLLDDQRGRQVASVRGLRIIGTLGILGTAAQEGWIDFADAIARLQMTNFRIAPSLLAALLQRYS